MKKSFHVFFLFVLFTFFAVNAAWAGQNTIQEVVTLSTDNETGEQYVNMIAHEYDDVGIAELSIPNGITTFKVYDDGGKNGDYGHPTKNTIIMTAPIGYTLQVTGTLRSNGEYAYLIVRDGDAESKILYNTRDHGDDIVILSTENDFVDEVMDIGTIVSTGNVMTLFFQTYNVASNKGLDLTVTVFPPKKIAVVGGVTGGSIQSDKSTAALNEKVTLTVSNADGYVLDNLVFTDDNNNDEIIDVAVDGGWYSREISFAMPNTDIHITPQFSDVLSGRSITLPVRGTVNANIPVGVNSFKVYDDGGPNGAYNSKTDVYLVLNTVPGSRILVQGSIEVDSRQNGDSLTIYDGYDDGVNVPLAKLSGTQTISVTSSSNIMTLHLKSKNYYQEDGLNLTVSVSMPRNVSLIQANVGGSASIDKTKPIKGETVTVTANPSSANGYVLKGLEIRQGSELLDVPVDVDWYSSTTKNTATFTMPVDADISVTPVFTNSPDELTSENFYVNMLKTGTKTVNIPANMVSFKVYDDGGKDGLYSKNADSHLELISSNANNYLQVTGWVLTNYSWALLNIYEGLKAFDEKKLLDDMHSSSNSTAQDIGMIIGAENKMRLVFTSTEEYPRAGLNLTVTVLPLRTISLNQADEGGSANISTQSANKSATVTVTATPSSGYLLKGLKIKGANSKVLDIPTNVNWLNSKNSSVNTASFTMPDENITVTPVFTNILSAENLFVTMPITKGSGTQTRYIPSGVTSFKLYDDGGKDGNYTADSYGWWELNAPKGSRLQVSGTVYTNGEHASLTIYDSKSNLYSDKNKILDQAHSTSSKAVGIGTITSTDSVLTFYFNADENTTTKPGLDLTVTVFAPRSITLNNSEVDVTLDKTTASYGETVNLNAKVNGKWLKEVAITDAIGNPLDVDMDISWTQTTYNGVSVIYSSAKFAMPNTDVVLTPVFVDEGSAEAGLYVNIPATGSKTVIQDVVPSFKVYDNGGESGNYGMNVDGTLILKPKYAYKVKVTGTVQTNGTHAYLTAFDVEGNEENVLLDQTSSVTNEKVDVSFESDKAVKLSFHSDASTTQESGLDLKVEFVPIGYTITVNQAENGTIECDMEAANNGDSVTVTAYPAEGYLLKEIKVINSNGGSIGSHIATNETVDWYSDPTKNTVKFAMPSLNVSIVPVFTNRFGDFVVTIPRTGTKNVSLSPYMNQFRVYNDGRNSRSGLLNQTYAYNADGNLVITAPEGYLLEVTGSVQTRTYSYLTIFDGETDADNLLDPLSSTCDDNGTCAKMDVGTLISSGRKVTLYFKGGSTSTDYSTTYYEGANLVVKLIKTSFGAVSIVKATDGLLHATINGDYDGTETLSIPEAIEVDAIDYNREIDVETPVTALLPVTLPAGTTVNADFYTLEKVEQVEGMKWQATMKYIGKDNLPQPNTPYAVILPEGQTKLEFNLNGNKATVRTGKVNNVCGLSSCTLDKNKQITNDWFFTGTYAYKQWNTGDEELGLAYAFAASDNPDGAAKGKFGKIKAGAFANATRCYLRKRDANVKLQQQNQAQQVAASPYVARYSINNLPETIDVEFVKDDEKGGRTVLRGRMNTVTGEFKMLRDYDLKGRKVNGVNKARGAYYGKKVLKK